MNPLINIFLFVFFMSLGLLGYFIYQWKKEDIKKFFETDKQKSEKTILIEKEKSRRKYSRRKNSFSISNILPKLTMFVVTILIFTTITNTIFNTEIEDPELANELNVTTVTMIDMMNESYSGISSFIKIVLYGIPLILVFTMFNKLHRLF